MHNTDASPLLPASWRRISKSYSLMFVGISLLIGLSLTSLLSHPLSHKLSESFSIVIATGIFMLVWNSRRFFENGYFLFVGIAYLFVGSLDLVHLLVSSGMEVFQPYGDNLSVQLWIAARYVESLSLLAAPLYFRSKPGPFRVLVAYSGVTSVLLLAIFYWQIFPVSALERGVETPFKRASEFVISCIFLASAVLLYKSREKLDRTVFKWLIWFILLNLVSELTVAVFMGGDYLSDSASTLFNILSFYFLYKAVIETGLRKPYDLLFRSLKQNEEKLRKARDELEVRVSERTAELVSTNTRLRLEIADRQQAQKETERVAHEWEETFNSIRDLISIHDRDFRIIRGNKAVADAFKMKPEDLAGKYCYKIFHGTEESWPDCPHQKVIETGKPVRQELFEPHLKTFLEVSVSPVLNDRGELLGTVHVAKDITKRKQAQQTIMETTELLERVFSSIDILIAYMDKDFNFIRVNRAYAEADGKAPEFFPGKNHFALYPNEENRTIFRSVVSTGKPYLVYERPFVYEKSPDRGITYWDWSLQTVKEKDGKVSGVILSLIDVTGRKRAEEGMERLRRQNELLLNSAGEGIIGLDLSGKHIFVNPAAAKMLGYEATELIGKESHSIWHHSRPDGTPYPREACWIHASYERKEKHHVADEVFWRKDGTSFPVEYTSTPIMENGRVTGAVVTFVDITERKEAEKEKENIQAQLLQSQKMEAVGTLAGGVAHDFNNMLTVIQGHAQLSMMTVDHDTPLYDSLKAVYDASVRAANLTRQLLLFSRQQPMESVPINLNETVNNLCKMLERLIGEDIAIQLDPESGLRAVLADPGKIEQVILNLAVNARDAMPKGGKLTIRTSNVDLDEEYCKVVFQSRPGSFVCLSVEDSGIGMDAKTLSKIFEPFFTTKDLGKGTGLGLSVVYGIVKQHEGWINVYSELGTGSIFRIYLPASSAKSEVQIHEKISLDGLKGRGEKILVVEDDEAILKLLRSVLSQNGYQVYDTKDTAQAWKVFNEHAGEFDLVLSDVILPDGEGIDLIDILLNRYPRLNVLFSSGYTDQKSSVEIIRRRGLRFLQKPYSVEKLLKVVGEVIEQGSPVKTG